MMESHLRALILAKLNEIARAEAENLVLTLHTHDEYLRIVGKVHGLHLAMEIIEEQYTEYVKG